MIFFVASTKTFAAATKRFVDRTKYFVVVTKYSIFVIPILANDFAGITKPFFPCGRDFKNEPNNMASCHLRIQNGYKRLLKTGFSRYDFI